jgi:hypothetical protein
MNTQLCSESHNVVDTEGYEIKLIIDHFSQEKHADIWRCSGD